MTSNRESYNTRILGQTLHNKIADSKILLVGAGGIGCELLKNLVMSGFKNIVIIDLDTIDISNLNRQFLFQRQHVKKAKAHVAKESALKFNPSVNITSLQANIKEPQFNVEWFKQFTLVLNALDNLDARRHVNSMCLTADIPLVESGTQGYLGQAYVIGKNVTECFDCQPKPTQKTYPVCTIRSTPSAPIHCIVWAKSFLFSQLFGNSEDEEALEEDKSEGNAKELEALARETKELKIINDAAGSPEYAKKVFDKVYNSDINRLLSMDSMWKNRKMPTPLEFDVLETQVNKEDTDIVSGGLPDQKVWDLEENFEMFKDTVVRLSTRLLKNRESQADDVLTFDKDDDDAMEFVTAASNLRAHVFDIEKKSLFDVKSMAGNIIPAIATTNAIIAGFVIMKAFGVLQGNIKNNNRIYLTSGSRFVLEANEDPNPNCGVCRSRSATVLVDFDKATLNDLIKKVLLPAGMDEEEIIIMSGNRMLYDIEFDDNVESTFTSFGLKAGAILRITEGDEESVDLILEQINTNEQVITLPNPIPPPKPKEVTAADVTMEEEQQHKKRRLSEASELAEGIKKARFSQKNTDDVILIDDDDEDIILL